MLTTIDHIKEIRSISQNLIDARIAPYIKEVEDAYILPAIGVTTYERLDSHPQGEPYTEEDAILLNGGYYDRPKPCGEGTERDRCYGLRLATAYYAYARVLKNNQLNVTAFGVTMKQGYQSQPVDDKDITDAVTEAYKMGDHYLQSCIRYFKRNEKKAVSPTASGQGGAKLKITII